MMNIDMSRLTPMMKQYWAVKEKHKDCILFYRLGDFYEMFFEDAILVSKELELTLTGKNCGLDERAPMCGIPYHAANNYLYRLVKKGYKVAICEQGEIDKNSKGLVEREVVRIVTPGTNLSMEHLDDDKNNYIVSVYFDKKSSVYALSSVDITTGDFLSTTIDDLTTLKDEINRYKPAEVLISAGLDELKKEPYLHFELESNKFHLEDNKSLLKDTFKVQKMMALGLDEDDIRIISSGVLLDYILETQKNSVSFSNGIQLYNPKSYMVLDASTRRNLELTQRMFDKEKRGSLLWVLDCTKTAMGARFLRRSIEQPLLKKEIIEDRLDAIELLSNHLMIREELRNDMNQIYDLERITSKILYKTINPRDLLAFKTSISNLPQIKSKLQSLNTSLMKALNQDLDGLEDLYELLDNALLEEAPISLKDGGIFKDEYHTDVMIYRQADIHGQEWLETLLEKEKERTGIKTLKIKFNKVFGYFLEVSSGQLSLVPKDYIRKQTLVNAERFVTEELQEMESKILGSREKLISLEYELFQELRERLCQNQKRILKTAKTIAYLDMILSLAKVASDNNYIRPMILEAGDLSIGNGRHPVVEKVLNEGRFISNDTYFNENETLMMITGPNMAGKSTYMRQVALIVLMAHLGSFVPATHATIPLVDRIFTRIGASDDLASGQSTFMVEMNEVASIIRNATSKSLLILDEIGRGTSTFDGLSIAWAVAEYIANQKVLGAKTLFATHYHELTQLESKLKGIVNYCIQIQEDHQEIIFLHKIVKGGANKSYGIDVAKIAGVPDIIINRAKEIASYLEASDNQGSLSSLKVKEDFSINEDMIRLKAENDLLRAKLNEIKQIDMDEISRKDAYDILEKFKENL